MVSILEQYLSIRVSPRCEGAYGRVRKSPRAVSLAPTDLASGEVPGVWVWTSDHTCLVVAVGQRGRASGGRLDRELWPVHVPSARMTLDRVSWRVEGLPCASGVVLGGAAAIGRVRFAGTTGQTGRPVSRPVGVCDDSTEHAASKSGCCRSRWSCQSRGRPKRFRAGRST